MVHLRGRPRRAGSNSWPAPGLAKPRGRARRGVQPVRAPAKSSSAAAAADSSAAYARSSARPAHKQHKRQGRRQKPQKGGGVAERASTAECWCAAPGQRRRPPAPLFSPAFATERFCHVDASGSGVDACNHSGHTRKWEIMMRRRKPRSRQRLPKAKLRRSATMSSSASRLRSSARGNSRSSPKRLSAAAWRRSSVTTPPPRAPASPAVRQHRPPAAACRAPSPPAGPRACAGTRHLDRSCSIARLRLRYFAGAQQAVTRTFAMEYRVAGGPTDADPAVTGRLSVCGDARGAVPGPHTNAQFKSARRIESPLAAACVSRCETDDAAAWLVLQGWAMGRWMTRRS